MRCLPCIHSKTAVVKHCLLAPNCLCSLRRHARLTSMAVEFRTLQMSASHSMDNRFRRLKWLEPTFICPRLWIARVAAEPLSWRRVVVGLNSSVPQICIATNTNKGCPRPSKRTLTLRYYLWTSSIKIWIVRRGTITCKSSFRRRLWPRTNSITTSPFWTRLSMGGRTRGV